MLERVHGVNNATSAREMAQEGLVRRARRAPGPGHKPRPTSQGGLGPIRRIRVMGGLLHSSGPYISFSNRPCRSLTIPSAELLSHVTLH